MVWRLVLLLFLAGLSMMAAALFVLELLRIAYLWETL